MAVRVVKRTYNEIFTDGDTDWLLGNVGDWQTLQLDVDVSINLQATQQQPVQIDYINNSFVLMAGQTWGALGFDNGMQVFLTYDRGRDDNDGSGIQFTSVFKSFSVLNVSASIMEVDLPLVESDFLGFDSIPSNFGTSQLNNVLFYSAQRPEGCRVQYTHLTNDNFQSRNLNSFVDGSTTEFVNPNLPDMTSVVSSMEAVGIQSGMSIQKMSVSYVGFEFDQFPIYRYKIFIKYMLSSFLEDIQNIRDREIPSFLEGDGSLTDNFNIKFFPEWNNPNVFIKNDLTTTERLGNTGWFDENFNQLSNNFEVKSVEYLDENGNQVDAIDYSRPTRVKATIGGITNLNSETECGVGFAWIPIDENDFRNKETPFYRNLFVSSGDTNQGFNINQLYPDVYVGGGIEGASMDIGGIKFTPLNGDLIFEGTMIPNGAFFDVFSRKSDSDRNYVFYLSVADGNLERNFSDRVTLLVDVNSLIKNIPPAGSYPYIDNAFLEHPEESNAQGSENIQSIIQDDLLCRLPFRIKKDGSTLFRQFTFGIEALNIGLNRKFDLQRYESDVSQFPNALGVHQIDVNETRGFKVNQGNNKNIVQIRRDDALDTVDFAGYLAFFAFKLRWEDWILNQDAPEDFFNQSELNDGFHNDWINYARTNGWQLNFFTEINATVDGDLVQYRNRWNIDAVDYDENENIKTTHKYYRDSDDTLLNIGVDVDTGRPLGVILQNEPTRVEIEFEILNSDVWDVDNVYAVTTIEIDNGTGQFEMRQLSSVWDSESNNPLIPIEGETNLKIEISDDGKLLKTSCLVDPQLLDQGARYRVTGRVGCLDVNGGDLFDTGLYEFRYESLFE